MKTVRAGRTLLVDLGNSRIKWALAQGHRLGRQQALPIDAAGAVPVALLLAALPDRIDAIRMVSVAHPARTQAIARALQRAKGAEVRLLRTTALAGGVRCGYHDPWRLGADRWAAIIGAHHLHSPPRAYCVVDAGTAMTIDFISSRGQHAGGVIVPAPALMVATLLRDTQGIRRRAAPGRTGPRTLFARSTREAIVQGAHEAAVALIERAYRTARSRYGRRAGLVITGGAAPELLPSLAPRHEHVPDLVLRGLVALD